MKSFICWKQASIISHNFCHHLLAFIQFLKYELTWNEPNLTCSGLSGSWESVLIFERPKVLFPPVFPLENYFFPTLSPWSSGVGGPCPTGQSEHQLTPGLSMWPNFIWSDCILEFCFSLLWCQELFCWSFSGVGLWITFYHHKMKQGFKWIQYRTSDGEEEVSVIYTLQRI